MSGYDTAVAKEMAVLNRLQLARAALADLTGLDASQAEAPDFPASLPNMLEGKPQEYWQQSAAEHNPELARQKLAAETARLALDETKARRLPRITAAAGYQNYHNRQEYGGSSQNYRSKGAVLSVQLTLPLFNGGQTASQSREAAACLNQTDALLTAAEQKVRREINLLSGCRRPVVSGQSAAAAAGNQPRQVSGCLKGARAWFEHHPAGDTGAAGRIRSAAEAGRSPFCLSFGLCRPAASCGFVGRWYGFGRLCPSKRHRRICQKRRASTCSCRKAGRTPRPNAHTPARRCRAIRPPRY